MNLSPTNEQDTEIAVRLELLRLALHNLGRSIPIQFLAVAWVAYLGLSADRPLAAVVVGAAVILADPIFQGLAIALMAGEIASLLLSRMTVPIVYYLVNRRIHS